MAEKTVKSTDWQVILRTAIMSIIILAALLFSALFIEKALSNSLPKYADDIRIAAVLFAIWLVVGAAIRSADNVKKTIEGWKLILLGTAIAVIAAFIYTVIKGYFPDMIWNTTDSVVYPFEWKKFGFFSVVGFVLSLTAVIRLRVGSKFWSKVLVYLVYIGIAVLVYALSRM